MKMFSQNALFMHKISTNFQGKGCALCSDHILYPYPSAPYSQILDLPLSYSWPELEIPKFSKENFKIFSF